jgi:hypothetical protein
MTFPDIKKSGSSEPDFYLEKISYLVFANRLSEIQTFVVAHTDHIDSIS